MTESYEGFAHDGVREGFGVYKYHDRSVYEGEWRGNKRDGWGRQTDFKGSEYEGRFRADCRHGPGVLINDEVPGATDRHPFPPSGRLACAGCGHLAVDVSRMTRVVLLCLGWGCVPHDTRGSALSRLVIYVA